MAPTPSRRAWRRTLSACALIGAAAWTPALAAPGPEGAPSPLLGVNVEKGHVTMAMLAPAGSTVTFYEVVGADRTEIATAPVQAAEGAQQGSTRPVKVQWRCDRVVRSFVAIATAPDGSTSEAANEARTPGCRDRIAIVAPDRLDPGDLLEITLKDRWQQGGVEAQLCIGRTRERRSCRALSFAPGQRVLTLSKRIGSERGVLDLDLSVNGEHRHQKVGVGREAPKVRLPRMLVTGDSMIQGIDAELADRLRDRFEVVSRSRPGTGVSKDLLTPWPKVAREQARKHRPAVTVVMLGVNDRHEMKDAEGRRIACCGEAWAREYGRRITAMARSWSRKGSGRVLWALLPPPRRPELAESIDVVNASIRRMAREMKSVVVVPFDELFGPGFRERIGDRVVRDPDGLHLSVAGERIAAEAIVATERGRRYAIPG